MSMVNESPRSMVNESLRSKIAAMAATARDLGVHRSQCESQLMRMASHAATQSWEDTGRWPAPSAVEAMQAAVREEVARTYLPSPS
jgi:hypothetical protein